ncbi:MAG: hypothetical protein K0Q52_3564 [Microbacterium sp.]|nr:hypothetical protein [Microbacterium sp.]
MFKQLPRPRNRVRNSYRLPGGEAYRRVMEIQPGVGVDTARLGESRAAIEARLGPPTSQRDARVFYHQTDPALHIDYDPAGNVESVEIPYSGTPGREVTLAGIPLTYRPIEDVVRELAAAGYSGRRSDIGYDFAEGFSVFSMSSLQLSDIDPSAADDDERLVAEGVFVASPAYLGF